MKTTFVKRFSAKPAIKDLIVITGIALLVFITSSVFDVFSMLISWIRRHETWQLDETFTVAVFLIIASTVYAWRRYREMIIETRRREQAEAEKAELLPELEQARRDVVALRRILPVCPSCKQIRDARGDWYPIEQYMEIHYFAKFNDGLCPRCAREAYREPTLHLRNHP